MAFDRKTYFDYVRDSLFSGSMDQDQVDGQEAILTGWEDYLEKEDVRFLAYMLATTYHETAQSMQPVEEYGKGAGMSYGVPDPETGQTYYGRGFVQLTWRDNYARADAEAGWDGEDSCLWLADNALELAKAARIMWFGMSEGWFRKDENGPQTLARYFNDDRDDPYGAREIINGDKTTVPSWSSGVSIGNLVKQYHNAFLDALYAAGSEDQQTPPAPSPAEDKVVEVAITVPQGVQVIVTQNEEDT